jgi:hypothetical protein
MALLKMINLEALIMTYTDKILTAITSLLFIIAVLIGLSLNELSKLSKDIRFQGVHFRGIPHVKVHNAVEVSNNRLNPISVYVRDSVADAINHQRAIESMGLDKLSDIK